MSWRERLGVPETSDTSDKSDTSVTSVTSSVDTENAKSKNLVFDPEHPIVVRARALLNQTGTRVMLLEAAITVGVWSDLDGPEIREALRTLGHERMSVLYLDSAGVPVQYKLRLVEGEPVPLGVLAEMERHPAAAWTARDRTLKEMGWCPKRNCRAEWKAAMLNRLFQEQSVIGLPGRITAATVRHGEAAGGKSGGASAVDCAPQDEQPMSPVEPTE